MKSEKRREMFADLYRLAEYYEDPPFRSGDIDGNAQWFADAFKASLVPFLDKWHDDALGPKLASVILDEANRLAMEKNKINPHFEEQVVMVL